MRLVLIVPILALALTATAFMPRDAAAGASAAFPASAAILDKAVSAAGQAQLHKAGVGFHLYIGPRYRHYRRYRYYRPYYYRRRYHRRRHYRRRYGRCGHWRKRCARNWGYGNKNYRGCMRYHGCR